MDIQKLKLDQFSRFKTVNFPNEINIGLESTDAGIEVILYYIEKIEDVHKFVDLCSSTDLPKENRTIMIYQKGRNDGVNRDSIFMPFKEKTYKGFKLKALMLCSLSNKYSACVMCKI